MPQYPRTISEAYAVDKLVAGLTQLVSINKTLISGQNLARGTVVGVITTSGKITQSLSASADGSQTPYGILADDYDATGADRANCAVYVKGEFNENAVILGTGHTIASVREGLRDAGIFLKPAVPA
jgi:pantothenate kinase type III